ncbi:MULTISPECIES: dTDP-4-dehydrorhamnose reductase [unclassified Ensifer]|uniref:dTDP-4-dehydrorhamnose reductase n=1 Tax=unclassified Ensifer TaxID=2633371 RepID=UPI000813C230|nr:MULTISPECIES: dTDP-4-dehydrorhamnose reductase [unclassified Ensifer]OCP10152.1 dTDP-4-dehydrorhamnose reductase [Ensifer sp. LC14]OCP12185.1 dTDP-4-dehydrorhamnose reductase [Ensifer sp. LC13]OCP13003.1 dTDP-4-dehydrorhamnose reductase [Ensifer sp. LC11]OCP33747.1 dTDP-4-dehydrorhamnose reductase [Ensifer sp. LC499]
MTTQRILVTGGTGQVGIELQRCRWPNDVEIVAPKRDELDLSDADAVARYADSGEFSVIVNLGAYTGVDRAENDVLQAWRVNALAPAALALTSHKHSVPIIHVSTDYVFDGSKSGIYVEEDCLSPQGVYGASKAGGEHAIRTGNEKHIILRTAWVFSEHGNNFVKTMLKLATQRQTIKVVSDQRGCPTCATDLATGLSQVINKVLEKDFEGFGTYNFVNSGEATWFTFAEEVFRQAPTYGHPSARVEPISTADYPTAALRPANSRLSNGKFSNAFGTVPRPWQEALSEVLVALSK